ncbi:MAG TPA: amino acid adenylation domain-containing protein [Flavobacterium sp.]|nr:amino acid adenylation domain-containing protein [Flavobacterium sp.]
MSTFQNTNTFFNSLRLNSGAIWVENGEIMFSAPKKFQNKETSDFIVSNKPQIIRILQKNDISSAKKFLNQKIFRDETQLYYPLSPAQERLWFIEQYEEGTNAYHLPAIYEVDVTINKEGINYALQQVISRHEILRSTIEQDTEQGHGVQIVHDKPLLIEDVMLMDTDDYDALIKEDVNRPFDLSKEYPIRVKFYTINSSIDNSLNKILLLVNTHHIASDGWSIDIFQKELYAYYDAYIKKDTGFSLPALNIQYKDYALWQKSYLTEDTLEKQLGFWKNKLVGYQTLEFPTDYTRPSQVDYKGAYHEFEINAKISNKLRELAQDKGASLNSVMLSSINVLLSKYTGQNDIVIGTVMANRHHRQTEELIGFFANTQANRALLSASQSFSDLIQQIHEEQTQAQLHQDFPFEKLVVELGVERDASRHPVFQVMFGVQSFGNENKSSEQQKNFFKTYVSEHIYESEKFDFTIFIDDSNEALSVQISYATSLFNKNTIAKLGDHYIYLLDQLTENPNKYYSELSLLDTKEYNQIIHDWNATEKEYLKNKTIHELFEEQAFKTPDVIALAHESQMLSYKELNEKSNQLACFIRAQYKIKTNQTLKPDTLIALYLDRGLELVIGILAVLKAGGAYVPMDPTYPQERIDYLLDDSKAELILSQRHLKNNSMAQLPDDKVIYIDIKEKLYEENNSENLPENCKSSDLAYVIYTSGTTGKPKGVMVEHKAFSQFIYNFNDRLKETINLTQANVLSLTNYVFDIFGLEYALPLITGNRITLSTIDKVTEEEVLNHQIIQQTPGTIFHLADKYPDKLANAVCLVGGEALSPAIAKKIIPAFKKVINVYGPAETVIWSSSFEVKDVNKPYIGTPLFNEKMYVLDSCNNPVTVGVIGELYIGGAGLSRGYLNRAELTEERFIPNPFATQEDMANDYGRLYKTGDLVRWLPDGNLEYIGRNDDQVKIHGYRIELGEIENALAQLEGIQKACVLAKEKKTAEGSYKYLVGYYVQDNNNNEINETILLKELSKILPEYMIPSVLVAMESFPLTINGKLDKRALPDTELGALETVYVAPNTQLEKEVCEIWKELLGINQVGVTNDFFKLGGNSILAIQVSHRMSKLLESHVKVADVFKNKTIRAILETCAIEEVEGVEWAF